MVSIIIPVYNTKPFLARCINSVKAQYYRDWECIIVDDGSTDGSAELARAITEKDQRFTIIVKPSNEGLSAARNTGMEHAKGDWLFFVDSDDWIEKDAVGSLFADAGTHPEAGRIIGNYVEHNERSGWVVPHSITPAGVHEPDGPHFFSGAECDPGHSTGCLYRRSDIPEGLVFPKVHLFEDMIFNMGLMFSGCKSLVTKRYIYRYIRRKGSLVSQKITYEEAKEMRKALTDLIDRFNPRKETADRCVRFLDKAMRFRISYPGEILVVIPFLASGAQGNELELAVTGWKKHFKNNHRIVVVGDFHPVIDRAGIDFIECPRIDPVPGQYLPHLDHVHKFREVRKHYPDTGGFIYTCDDIYATKDFTLDDVLVPKHPEIGPYFKLYDWHSNAADWWSDRGKTGELCEQEGLPVRDWVCHLPVYYEWDKLFEIYDKYDCDHNSYIVENIYFSKVYGNERSIPATEYRDEVRNSNPGGIHPIGSRTWITNANCGWSKRLEEILRKHYGI